MSCGGSGSRLSAASERGGMSKPIQGFISWAAFTFMAAWSSWLRAWSCGKIVSWAVSTSKDYKLWMKNAAGFQITAFLQPDSLWICLFQSLRAALFLLGEDEDMNQPATGNRGQWRELMASVIQLDLPNLLVALASYLSSFHSHLQERRRHTFRFVTSYPWNFIELCPLCTSS